MTTNLSELTATLQILEDRHSPEKERKVPEHERQDRRQPIVNHNMAWNMDENEQLELQLPV